MKNKLIALFIALVMVTSMMSAAVAETSAGQIVNAGGTVYYDSEGNRTNDTLGQGNSVVEMTKTVVGTGNENEFEVTLQVKTTQDVRVISSDTPDAAVILVLDLSNSMDDCVKCGKEANDDIHKSTTAWDLYCNNNTGSVYETSSPLSGPCVNCGESSANHHWGIKTTVQCEYESRLSHVKQIAKNFISKFANETNADADDKRMVSIVTFNTNASRVCF